jgi:hypothetical protein
MLLRATIRQPNNFTPNCAVIHAEMVNATSEVLTEGTIAAGDG